MTNQAQVDVDDRDLADARQARDSLGAVFAAHEANQNVAALLNDLLARTAQPRPSSTGASPCACTWTRQGRPGALLRASGAMALALLIAEHGTDVLGRCAAPGCAHVLLRTGPGPARRYYDNACASRTRVAASRARQADGAVREPGRDAPGSADGDRAAGLGGCDRGGRR